ncbi:MAG: aminopeptidase [Candidatus Aenigmarchaeota archaeon]|nr:aminopeptidase [Candidatus Aenigmarchaeota archaeon]
MFDLKKLALDVCDTLKISQKDNENIEKARNEFGSGFIDQLLQKKNFELNGFLDDELKTIEKLRHPDYGPLIYKIDNTYYTKEKVSENIRIRYVFESEECFALAKIIREECYRRGCTCAIIPLFEGDQKEYLSMIPEDVLFELNPMSIAIAKNMDVSIFIGDISDPNWSKGLEKKISMSSHSNMIFWGIYEKFNIRGALLALPVERKETYVSKDKYRQVFYDSLLASFSDEMRTLIDIYEKKLKDIDTIRIVADDGTDLSFSIKDRKILRDDKYAATKKKSETYNFPTGEVFVAPVETSANGRIIFDYVTPRGFGLIENLDITFKDGKVSEYTAKGDGAEKFKKFLDANTGEKDRIAELGIGCNPKAEFIGTTIVDEKIFGSIHIAIGFNLGSFQGKNQASSHQDMIKIMKDRGGCLYADGKMIMKDGMPLD